MNRTELLKKLINKPEPIEVVGYGTYLVKGMNTLDYLFAGAEASDEKGELNQEKYFAALITRCVLDSKGKRLFKDEDLEVLTEGDAGFILPLALKIQELSGVLGTEDDVKKS